LFLITLAFFANFEYKKKEDNPQYYAVDMFQPHEAVQLKFGHGELFLLVPNAPDICQGEGKLELVRNLAVNILLEEGEQREVEPRPFGVLALTGGNN
jgi:hypothetical protein